MLSALGLMSVFSDDVSTFEWYKEQIGRRRKPMFLLIFSGYMPSPPLGTSMSESR